MFVVLVVNEMSPSVRIFEFRFGTAFVSAETFRESVKFEKS